jgi:hypothetical protein
VRVPVSPTISVHVPRAQNHARPRACAVGRVDAAIERSARPLPPAERRATLHCVDALLRPLLNDRCRHPRAGGDARAPLAPLALAVDCAGVVVAALLLWWQESALRATMQLRRPNHLQIEETKRRIWFEFPCEHWQSETGLEQMEGKAVGKEKGKKRRGAPHHLPAPQPASARHELTISAIAGPPRVPGGDAVDRTEVLVAAA